MNYKIEYLIIIPVSDCQSREFFTKHLSEHDLEILEGDNKIIHKHNKGDFFAQYNLFDGTIQSDKKSEEYRFYRLSIFAEINEQEDNLNLLTNLSEAIIKCIQKRISQNAKINTLWNDIARAYAIEAYPLINEIENLMRKLISEFMLENIGLSYSKSNLPEIVAKKIEQRDRAENENNIAFVDDLYKVDFEHLAEALFRKYQNIEELNNELTKDQKLIDISKLKQYLPNSNWSLFFAEFIKEEEASLKDDWTKLSKLRNKIAHNRHVSRTDLNNIKKICTKLKGIIIQGINNLPNIKPSITQKANLISDTYARVVENFEEIIIICEGKTDEKILSILIEKIYMKYNYQIPYKILVAQGLMHFKPLIKHLESELPNHKIILVADNHTIPTNNKNEINHKWMEVNPENVILIEPFIEVWLTKDASKFKDGTNDWRDLQKTFNKSTNWVEIVSNIDVEELRQNDKSFEKLITALKK